MNLYYFGGDKEWQLLKNGQCKRRNEYILYNLLRSGFFDHVFVVRKTYPQKVFQKLMENNTYVDGVVYDVFTASIIPEYFNFSAIRLINRLLNKWMIKRQTNIANAKDDILWCYWPAGFIMAALSGLKGRIVFDADHNIVDDINSTEKEKSEISTFLLGDVITKSSLIVSGSRSMNAWFNTNGYPRERLLRLRNAIEESFISTGLTKHKINNAVPVITYVGVLSNWIEYDLLARLIERNRNWHFQIIGQQHLLNEDELKLQSLESLPNVSFLGPKEPNEVRQILRETDVGLVLYKNHLWLDGDSMKIYDYLCSGVPVVGTEYHQNLNTDYDGLIQLAHNVDEFEIKINQCLRWSDAERAEWMKKADSFLSVNTWKIRVQSVLERLD
jgi:hypothetical protein